MAVREPGASFLHRIFDGGHQVHAACASAAARGQHRLDGVLPGLPRRCAARSAEAQRRHTPPQALHMSRRGSRGAARVLCIGFSTASDACRSLRGSWYLCFLSVDTRARVLVEKSTVMRIATVMISYRVRCSDEYDTLAQDLY